MNDLDIRHAVQAAGEDISPAFRRELAGTVRAELAGDTTTPPAPVLRLDEARRTRRLGLWGGIGIVGIAAATVTTLAITHDEQAGIVVSDTGGAVTTVVPSASTVPGPFTTDASTASTAPVETTGTTTATGAGSLVAASAPDATSQGSAVVSPDSAKQPLAAVAIADLPIDAGATGMGQASTSFLPDGGLLVVDAPSSTAAAVDLTGATRWSTPIPPTLADATPWDAALGPDGVLYVSYATGEVYAPETFTLAAIPTTGPNAGTIVAQWDTDWQCVEGTCGEVTLRETGIDVAVFGTGADGTAPYVDANGAPSGATYDVSALEQTTSISETPLPAGYADPADVLRSEYGFYGAGGLDVVLGDDTWHLDALGVQFVEGAFAFATEQPDGSVLAVVSPTKDPALPGVSTLVRMLPGGAIEQYLLPDDSVSTVGSVDGVLYGVEAVAASGSIGLSHRLVGLVPDGDAVTGTEGTVVPTTVVATDSGLPPAVASLPTMDQTLGLGEDRLTMGDAATASLTAVLAGRADGSGDVFATRPAADENGVLVLVRPDGSITDLGIPIGMRGGVVSSTEDRLYVWDRTSYSGDAQQVTWTVYEPSGEDTWRQAGDTTEQTAAGECTFYVTGGGCLSAAQAAPLVAGDTVDWAVASPDLTTLTVSRHGAATIRDLVEPDLDTAVCFDVDCSFQFAPGASDVVYAWHHVANADGTNRTALIGMHDDGTSVAVWLPGTNWYVLGDGGALLGWHLGADGLVDSITSWPLTGL